MSNLEKTYKEHNLRSELYKVLYQPNSEKTNQVWKLFFVCCRVLLSHYLESLVQSWRLRVRCSSRPTPHLKSHCVFYFHSRDQTSLSLHWAGCFMVLLSQQIDRNSSNDALQYNTRVILSPDGLWSLLISPDLALTCYDAYYILSIELLW